jgi:hypothetical protein
MTRRVLASLALVLAVFATPVAAIAQPARLKDAIIGSWVLVSARGTRADGAVMTPYGPRAGGTMWFDQKGRFGIILINPDTPKFASGDRDKPTPVEAVAAATGSAALFGSYTVDGAKRTVTLHVEASSYPNDNGSDQTRVVKSIGETELVLVIPASSNGGAGVELALRRVE